MEAAIATPVIFLLLFGVLEFGSLLYSYETLTNGSTSVARTAAIMGSDATADYEIVQAAKKSLAGVNQNQIQRMVIWNATPRAGCSSASCQGPGSVVPPTCLTGSSTTCTSERRTRRHGGPSPDSCDTREIHRAFERCSGRKYRRPR